MTAICSIETHSTVTNRSLRYLKHPLQTACAELHFTNLVAESCGDTVG